MSSAVCLCISASSTSSVALGCQENVFQHAPAATEAAVGCRVGNLVLLQLLLMFQQTGCTTPTLEEQEGLTQKRNLQ
jgi:hypothetical protein